MYNKNVKELFSAAKCCIFIPFGIKIKFTHTQTKTYRKYIGKVYIFNKSIFNCMNAVINEPEANQTKAIYMPNIYISVCKSIVIET